VTTSTTAAPRTDARITTDADRELQAWIAPRVSVVIPTYNEADNLRVVLPRIPANYEILVVDGASTDDTVATALSLRPDVRVVRQLGSGKGDALIAGWRAATGDIVVTLDADGSALPEEIPAFVDALVAGADYAKGSRYLDGGGSTDLTWLRSTGNKALSLIVNVLFGTRYSDLCYGYNAFWRRHGETLAGEADGFEIETLMNIRAAQAGLRITEVPSVEHDRIHGTSNLRPFRDGLRIARLIVRERRHGRRRHDLVVRTSRRQQVPEPVATGAE